MTNITDLKPGILHLPAAARIATPWKNGGGITREVAKAGDPFLWRVSIAEVASEGPFSKFAGYRRWISVIDGAGMELRDATGGSTRLRPYQACVFDGGDDIYGALPDGPVSDLNLMFQPEAVRGALEFPEEACRLESGTNRIVLAINVGKNPASLSTTGGPLELASLDGALATGGAVLELPAGRRYAVIRIEGVGCPLTVF